MKRRQILALAGVLLVVGVLVPAGQSAAKSSKTPVDFWEVSCLKDPGMEWISDGVLHGRGRVTELTLYVYDSVALEAVVAGSGAVIGNANIVLETGNGNLFGTSSLVYLPASATGTLDGTWNGKLTGWVSFSGKGVLHGTGELRGMKAKLSIESDPVPSWLGEELSMNPPCTPDEPLAGIGHDTGFIHDPHGG